jgi:hypothetical protein
MARVFARSMLDGGDAFDVSGDASRMQRVAVAAQHVHDWTAAHCAEAFQIEPLEPPPAVP